MYQNITDHYLNLISHGFFIKIYENFRISFGNRQVSDGLTFVHGLTVTSTFNSVTVASHSSLHGTNFDFFEPGWPSKNKSLFIILIYQKKDNSGPLPVKIQFMIQGKQFMWSMTLVSNKIKMVSFVCQKFASIDQRMIFPIFFRSNLSSRGRGPWSLKQTRSKMLYSW